MNGKTKNRVIALLAGGAAICLGGAIVCTNAPAGRASAAVSYEAFVNVGANTEALAADTALGLSAKGAEATAAGVVTSGSTLFASYSTNATYSLSVSATSEYRISVALKAEEGKKLTVGGQDVSLSGKSGNCVVYADQTVDGSVEVSYEGALCGVLVASKDSKILMTADYALGQVVSYGALLADELDGATAHYSDGTTKDLPIEYGEINAGTGINVNFTTIDVTGTVDADGVSVPVSRYLTTMPDDLVYFINCGSYDVLDTYFPEPNTIDDCYSYNQTIFDYYGDSLLNDVPDRKTTQGGDWGIYTEHAHNAPGDASFPYNSIVWTGGSIGVHDMGYMLSGLKAGTGYRVWLGTLSHWHGRTANITFNGQVVGEPTFAIGSSKGFTIFENVVPDANGKVDIHMTQVGSENEPTLCFIAVQPMSVEIPAAPSAPKGPSVVGMEDTSVTLTEVQAGANIRLYNEDRPQQLLYEETVDEEKIGADGSYVLDWGEPLTVSRVRIVQINAGGVSSPLRLTVTDIKDFKAYLAVDAYSTSSVTVCVEAQADSGIAEWSYRLGEYGQVHTVSADRPYKLEASFVAEENGVYYIVVTSGLGVTYSATFTVDVIDREAPVIGITPSKDGFKSGSYNVALNVTSVAPVVEYKLYKDGKEVVSEASAPASIKFDAEGEYVIYVKTAAGQSASTSLRVSDSPVTTVVRKTYARRQLTYTFGDSTDYVVYSVTAYQLTDSGASRMTIANGNSMDVYDEGTYVVSILTKDGTTEMFALNVTKADFNADNTGVVNFSGSEGGCSSTVGTASAIASCAIIAAAAVVLTFVLKKRKKS